MKTIINAFAFLIATALLQTSLHAEETKVTADDTMRFSVSEISAKAGEPITIVLNNVGNLPKQAMGHNLVVLKAGADVATFANAAIVAAANEYIPSEGDAAAQVVAHTKLLGPGESDSITITFDEAGSYPFLCSFPGHWALMRGVIVVK